ncbi:zinc finger BED domain-containing protein RICESLEEPER 2-like protein [Tanacetum coccineum]
MQNRGATNSVSPMHGSTSNQMQSRGENRVEVDGQSSQYEHEYIILNDMTIPTQDTNQETGERDTVNNNGEDEVELKSKRQKTSKVCGDFIQVALPDEYEPHFSHLPSDEDWENVKAICEEVYKVKQIIDKSALSRNDFISEMAEAMKEKFDKYWGECYLLIAITVRSTSHKSGSCRGSTNSRSNEDSLGSEWEEFGNFYKGAYVEKCDKSELKKYLEEGLLEGHWGVKFNALKWWNVHELKYPVFQRWSGMFLQFQFPQLHLRKHLVLVEELSTHIDQH